jgi:hypothetical protein
VSQEECARLREGVPYVKVEREREREREKKKKKKAGDNDGLH